MNTRYKSLDILRVLAAFTIVVIHVSSYYVVSNIKSPNSYFTIANFFNSFGRLSVPIFVMLSGAFLLDNSKNKNYKFFYNKTFINIIVPTFFWSCIYCLYSISLILVRKIVFGNQISIVEYLSPFLDWVKGKPFYHLWYMYMLIGLYFTVPIIIRIKDDIGEKNFLKLSIILSLLSIIICNNSNLFWMVEFIVYLGYFTLGYSLKKYYSDNIKKPFKYIIVAFISIFFIFICTEFTVRAHLKGSENLYFYEPHRVFVMIGSICLFIAFLNLKELKTNKIIDNLVENSLNIYLIHAGIISIVNLIKNDILRINLNPIWYIPVMSIVIFILSYVLSLTVKKILNFNKLIKIKDKIERILV